MLAERSLNLMGSENPDGSRTTFTDTLQATAQKGCICQFSGLDFVGPGRRGRGVRLRPNQLYRLLFCRVAHRSAVLRKLLGERQKLYL